MHNDIQIDIQPATSNSRSLLERLCQFYLYDFSEFMGTDIDEQGRFDPGDLLDGCWTDARRQPYLVRVSRQIAGFAIIDRLEPQAPGDPEWEMAEFFILRKYRRHGIGRTVARWLFARHPGRWVVKTSSQNAAAVGFWHAVVGDTVEHSDEIAIFQHGLAQWFTV